MAHIQIRNVPPEVHETLKERAARSGRSLSEYLLDELTRLASLPTLEELAERLRTREPVVLSEDPAVTIRREREKRDRQIARAVRGRR
ncbi:MAG: FitA-like ribbon-helix-helix domain-containing protein [Gaiellaceae bacterium]